MPIPSEAGRQAEAEADVEAEAVGQCLNLLNSSRCGCGARMSQSKFQHRVLPGGGKNGEKTPT